MIVCTYDDPQAADADCQRLRSAGIRAAVVNSSFTDPDQPDVPHIDVVVFDDQLAAAQRLLGTLPPADAESSDDELVPTISLRIFQGMMLALILGGLAAMVYLSMADPVK
jgi:hypothetical protein